LEVKLLQEKEKTKSAAHTVYRTSGHRQ